MRTYTIILSIFALISSATATTFTLTGTTSFTRTFDNLRGGTREATVPWALSFAGLDSSQWRITGVTGILETTTTWSGTVVVLGNAPASVATTGRSTSSLPFGPVSLNTDSDTILRTWDLGPFGARSWNVEVVDDSGTQAISTSEWSRFYGPVNLSGQSLLSVSHTQFPGSLFATQSSQTLRLQQKATFLVTAEPVPEPATLVALTLSMIAFGTRKRKS